MSVGVPSTNVIQPVSLESLYAKSKLGVSMRIPAEAYIQSQGNTTGITNSATSIFKDSAAVGQRVFPANFWADHASVYTSNSYISGAVIKLTSCGAIANATTPTVTVSLGQTVAGTFTDYTGSTFTGALATIANGPYSYRLEMYMWCPIFGSGTTGTIYTVGMLDTFAGNIFTTQSLGMQPVPTASLDTTLSFTLECKLNTSAGTMTPYLNIIEVLN